MVGIGSRPGERRGGRRKGTPNKVTADIKALAREYTAEAIEGLAELARNAKNEQTRHAAWNSLLDRGHGRPAQVVKGDGDGTLPISVIHRVIVGLPEPDDCLEADYDVVDDDAARLEGGSGDVLEPPGKAGNRTSSRSSGSSGA